MAAQDKRATLAALVEGYKSGEVTAPLMLDNDQTCVCQESAPGADDHECVCEMHPEELLEAALGLLGIPYDHV